MSKRKRSNPRSQIARKRSRVDGESAHQVDQPLLEHYYSQVKTLRDYLLAALPASSRVRRKRLLSFVQTTAYSDFFHTTLVGVRIPVEPAVLNKQHEDIFRFTQIYKHGTGQSATTQQLSIEELLDFVVWSLFKSCESTSRKPSHILCHGLDRYVATSMPGVDRCRPLLPGIIERYPNSCRAELSTSMWRQLLSHLGIDGQSILATLLIDCGVFVSLDPDTGNLRQLSGTPLPDLDPKDGLYKPDASVGNNIFLRKPSDIKFIRSRIFYGRPTVNPRGNIMFGFRHIHLLNRLTSIESPEQDILLLKYIFPRQFGLHNCFTSPLDRRETTQAFKDYTVRDRELLEISKRLTSRVPRRLRGEASLLAHRLRLLHQRCSYSQLMYHFCPTPFTLKQSVPATMFDQHGSSAKRSFQTQSCDSSPALASSTVSMVQEGDVESSFLPYITSTDRVSAFCRSVLLRLLPRRFLGTGKAGDQNTENLMRHIDRFVHMRKFETFSLHELCQGMVLKAISWLSPTATNIKPQKLALSDLNKREQMMQEFLYYVVDSILIPLISANFYVTESGIHRNQLLFFRHDIWERLCRPTLASSKLGPLVPATKAQLELATKPVEPWYSIVRLLPKEVGTRMIANFKRRVAGTSEGKPVLAQSVNARLTSVFNIFNYERQKDMGVFNSDNLSMRDLGDKLLKFKTQFWEPEQKSFYFVKVDIQSAFDSIPQDKLLLLVNQIFTHDHYLVTRLAEGRNRRITDTSSKSTPTFRFVKSAHSAETTGKGIGLSSLVVTNKKHTVFSETDHRHLVSATQAKRVLQQHIECNIVKIGRDFYRNSEGIAQGSILSSLLCTFFYNDFEAKKLGFLDTTESILLRIMDDFLLITTDKSDARRFMMAMKAGDTTYGIKVNPEKSLVNFDITIEGIQVPKLTDSSCFPFCGLFIDTDTLQVGKNRQRKDNVIANSLTVDVDGKVGVKLTRRILSSLRIQFQTVLINCDLNNKERLVRTLVESIQETTMKMHQYYTAIPAAKRPDQKFLINLAEQLMHLAARTLTERNHGGDIFTRSQIRCWVATGMLRVLEMRRSLYPGFLIWLRDVKTTLIHRLDVSPNTMEQLVDRSFDAVKHYVF